MTATPTPRPQAPSPTDAPTFDCRVDFADELAQLARADERIVAVCNDSVGSSNLTGFRDEFPDRLINVGIAEQDLVGVGAGLANAGLIPFVCAAAPFLTGRATEQIKADVAYSQRHVVLCGQSPGMAYGELGPDPPLDRGPLLDAGGSRPAGRRPCRPATDPVRRALGRRASAAAPTCGSRGSRCPRSPAPTTPSSPAGRSSCAPAPTSRSSRSGRWSPVPSGPPTPWPPRASPPGSSTWPSSSRSTGTPCSPPPRRPSGIVTVEEATVSGGLGAAVASVVTQEQPVPDADPGRRQRVRPDGERDLPARPLRAQRRGHRRRCP